MSKFQVGDQVKHRFSNNIETVLKVLENGNIFTNLDITDTNNDFIKSYGTLDSNFTLIKSIDAVDFNNKLEEVLNE